MYGAMSMTLSIFIEYHARKNLRNLFNDDIDLTQTERQIMESHGYVRVYDSGVIRWEYANIHN